MLLLKTTPMTMKALVYQGPGKKAVEERPVPDIQAPTDAIVKIARTTICGTDLHILKGDRQRGRAWGQGRSASGAALGSKHHDHHAPGRYRHHADAAKNGAGAEARS
jgi:threonine dehydrogenase-like Zn-dependent dehydrogenase